MTLARSSPRWCDCLTTCGTFVQSPPLSRPESLRLTRGTRASQPPSAQQRPQPQLSAPSSYVAPTQLPAPSRRRRHRRRRRHHSTAATAQPSQGRAGAQRGVPSHLRAGVVGRRVSTRCSSRGGLCTHGTRTQLFVIRVLLKRSELAGCRCAWYRSFLISFHVNYEEQECYLQTHTTPSPPCRDRPWWLSGVKSPTATGTLHQAPSCSCAPTSHHALPLTKAPDS